MCNWICIWFSFANWNIFQFLITNFIYGANIFEIWTTILVFLAFIITFSCTRLLASLRFLAQILKIITTISIIHTIFITLTGLTNYLLLLLPVSWRGPMFIVDKSNSRFIVRDGYFWIIVYSKKIKKVVAFQLLLWQDLPNFVVLCYNEIIQNI